MWLVCVIGMKGFLLAICTNSPHMGWLCNQVSEYVKYVAVGYP